ncbi:unnamed protein product [Bemisia tabaci]|uniref:Uncharacterized protein n=4 Tax=Bemisia tabaci TaxID=7038 RepID=A0A9P0AHI2_BEMTA|nr:unnamed protein product [Bemisia tabaci]
MNDTDSSLKKSSLSKSTLKNSAQISSVPLIVSELVYNSLSADAQSIAVRLELNRQKLQVVDNGIGMTEIQLNQLQAR